MDTVAGVVVVTAAMAPGADHVVVESYRGGGGRPWNDYEYNYQAAGISRNNPQRGKY